MYKKLLALFLCILLPLQAQATIFGRAVHRAAVSGTNDQVMGQELMQQLAARNLINDDPFVTEYIKSVGERLSKHSNKPDQKFHFFVMNNPQINAFAGPGGYIGVNNGMILALQNEDQLAAVLAHEIAHVTQGHLNQQMDNISGLKKTMIAGALLAIALGTQSPAAASGALTATMAGAHHQILSFSRDQEREADRVGIVTLKKSSFDPNGMNAFLAKMKQEERYHHQTPELLSTHPLTDERIIEAQYRIPNQKGSSTRTSENLDFALVQSRVRIQTISDPHQLLSYFKVSMESTQGVQQTANRYGYGLALLEARQPQQAYYVFGELVKQNPETLVFKMGMAQAAKADNQSQAAIAILQQAYQAYPNDYILNLTYADTLLQSNQSKQALRLLQKFALNNPEGPKPFGLLSRIQSAAGHPEQAYQTRAQFYQSMGDYSQAIEQLTLAKQVPNISPATKMHIEAKIHDLAGVRPALAQ